MPISMGIICVAYYMYTCAAKYNPLQEQLKEQALAREVFDTFLCCAVIKDFS